jgi:hypothetical protein
MPLAYLHSKEGRGTAVSSSTKTVVYETLNVGAKIPTFETMLTHALPKGQSVPNGSTYALH